MYTPDNLKILLEENGFKVRYVTHSIVHLENTLEVDCSDTEGYGVSAYIGEVLVDFGYYRDINSLESRLTDILVFRRVY